MIRPLDVEDAGAYVQVRQQALIENPLAFLSSPEEDRFDSVDKVVRWLTDTTDAFIIGALEPELVGTVGLYREPRRKARHRMRVWGVYVAPMHRGRGIGSRLLAAAVEQSKMLQGVERIGLSVSGSQPAALALYRAAGFEVWGHEPDALRHAELSEGIYHLSLDLRPELP